jgi:hypothetical protein
MVEATVKWSSVTKEFGFFTPHDASRDVFVLLVTSENPRGASEHQNMSLLKDVAAPKKQRGAGVESHRLASAIEVHDRHQVGRDSGNKVSQ